MKKSLGAFIAFVLFGWFCAWIGGVQPFTVAAGTSAFATIVVALIAAAIADALKLR